MPTIIANVQNALKSKYLPYMGRELDEKTGPFFAMIDKNSDHVKNGKIEVPLHYGRHGGIGSRGELDELPTGNAPKWKKGEVELSNLFGVIQLSDKLIKTATGDTASFVNILSNQMETLIVDTKDNIRRQLFGDGSGIITTCKTTTSKNVIPVISTIGLYEGISIDILSSTGTAKAQEREILVVDRINNTIKISGDPVTTATGDIITIAGSYNLEIIGLKKILTPDSLIYGIDRKEAKWYNPTIKTLSDALDEMDMVEICDNIRDYMGAEPNFVMTTSKGKRAYIENQRAYKRNTEYTTIKGGFKEVSFAGKPLTVDKYAEEGTMDFLNTEDFSFQRVGNGCEWMDKDGDVLHRMANKPGYSATLTFYGNLICKHIARQAQLRGVR